MLRKKKAPGAAKPALAKAAAKRSKTATPAPGTVPVTPVSMSIEEYAYYLWEKEGRPENRALEIWLRAEKEIFSRK